MKLHDLTEAPIGDYSRDWVMHQDQQRDHRIRKGYEQVSEDAMYEDGDIPRELIPPVGLKRGSKARIWRGVSDDTGTGMASFGMGLYTTTNKRYAARFGKVIEMDRWDDLPMNPIRFDTEMEFQNWLYKFDTHNGFAGARDRGQTHNDLGQYIRSYFPDIDGIQIGKGLDAMFVLWPANESITESNTTTIPIKDLLKSEAGMAIASANNGRSMTKKPVVVTKTPDGYLYVLNGYHRIQDAIQRGDVDIEIEVRPWDEHADAYQMMLSNERGRFIGGKKF